MPKHLNISIDEWFERLNIVVGTRQFSKADIKREAIDQGQDAVKYTARLEQVVELTEPETDVLIETETIEADSDPAANFFSRYASSGFSASIVRDADHLYDAAWYLYCSPDEHKPAKGYVNRLPNGIAVRTNDWVLPGEGVALITLPKVQLGS